MIGSLTLAVMAATLAATPCEGLKNISLPNTTITTAVLVPEGVYTPPAPPRGANAPAANAGRGAEGRGGGTAQNQSGRGAATPPQPIIAPAHCKVVAVLKPTSDSLINMELWLPPANAWNGKFEAVGNGGWAGSIQGLSAQGGGTPPMVNALRAGYATAGNDTGHEGANGQFTL